jgi:hypothetical protein
MIMKQLSSSKSQMRACPGLVAMAAAIYMASFALAIAEDTKAAATNAPAMQVGDLKPAKKPEKKKLTGAELYTIHCNRCHAERYATEFTSAQWKTIMTHMRVRANLPAAQAREILKYLQEDSGN